MIAVFAAQDVGHQRGADKALWNGAAWHLGLHDRLATGAGQTQAGDLVYDVVAGLLEDDSLDHFLTCLTLFQLFHYIAPSTLKLTPQSVQASLGVIVFGTRLRSLENGLRVRGVRV